MTIPAPRQPVRRPGRPTQLTAERIVQAAIEIGLEDFTMKTLADHLGISSQALYRWVANREELLDLVADSVVSRIDLPPIREDGDWQRWLAEFSRELRTELLATPGAAVRGLVRFQVSGPMIQLHVKVVEALTAEGLSQVQAVRAAEIFGVSVVGWVAREDGIRSQRRQGRKIAEELRRAGSGPSTDGAGSLPDPEERFEGMIKTLLVGLDATL